MISESEDEDKDTPNETIQARQQYQEPTMSGMKIPTRAPSIANDHISTTSRASVVSAMSIQSNNEFKMNTSEAETLDPFMRYLNSRMQGIRDTRKRRNLEDLFLNAIKRVEDAECNEN